MGLLVCWERPLMKTGLQQMPWNNQRHKALYLRGAWSGSDSGRPREKHISWKTRHGFKKYMIQIVRIHFNTEIYLLHPKIHAQPPVMWLQQLVNCYINSALTLLNVVQTYLILIYQPFVLSALDCEPSETAVAFLLYAEHNGLLVWAIENNHVGSRQPYKCWNCWCQES